MARIFALFYPLVLRTKHVIKNLTTDIIVTVKGFVKTSRYHTKIEALMPRFELHEIKIFKEI